MFIQVPVMVADKTDRPAADGVGLTVKNVDPCAMLNNHNFMKIMMMLRKCRHRGNRGSMATGDLPDGKKSTL